MAVSHLKNASCVYRTLLPFSYHFCNIISSASFLAICFFQAFWSFKKSSRTESCIMVVSYYRCKLCVIFCIFKHISPFSPSQVGQAVIWHAGRKRVKFEVVHNDLPTWLKGSGHTDRIDFTDQSKLNLGNSVHKDLISLVIRDFRTHPKQLCAYTFTEQKKGPVDNFGYYFIL